MTKKLAPGNNLREFRVKKLLTQKELAEKAGVCQVTISFTENSLSAPIYLTKQKLARVLKCTPKELFPDEGRRRRVHETV
ncbi:MAG: helix-turn-helix domain-containing protein [Nanoarchaeota archaeon]|nr:helix-turn-helix domain-containing protein [Nanoarchaeota archaeon]MBU1135132.1 helix-turn-helix domain-containing protein [Nanoarchaeota archaeon]MBU2520192.1 helix-turn-helix domain-containing protein [Nanoarchaeota archaeon]